MPQRVFRKARRFLARLRDDVSGQIAMSFAISAVLLLTAIGGGLDFSRAMIVRQELSNAAALTCQYSSRPAVAAIVYSDGNGVANYKAKVNAYANSALAAEKFALTQTVASPFTYTPGGTSSVTLSANLPTTFLQVIQINTVPLTVTLGCAAGSTQPPEVQNANVFSESFEVAACTGYCWGGFAPDGSINKFSSTPSNTPTSKVAYIGKTNTQWSVMGYCLEVDSAGKTVATAADGARVAELDCDNGANTAGNSSISNKSYLSVGTYELRYNYEGRIDYAAYNPAYICGSTAADVSWANDTGGARGTALRTNQINVYLDMDTTGVPPTHTTMDGTQTLAGSNLIDVCVFSTTWVERSVKINITTAGYYWTSFAADGANDSFGGQIDNLRLCRNTCSGAVNDNFPSSWGGSKVLFNDTFEAPAYTQDTYTPHYIAKAGNPGLSQGTSGTSAYGWPELAASGWAAAPYNEMIIGVKGAYEGSQHIALDGWNNGASGTTNRLISRPFLLDPGYYKIEYAYLSMITFASGEPSNPNCTYAPASGYTFGNATSQTGTIRYYTTTTATTDTNMLGVFMAHGQMVSTPNATTTLLNATTYTNPDGTVTTTPKVAPDAMSTASYDATQVNPLLDFCAYADAWQPRATYAKIVKPGIYWLTFSAQMGQANGNGPAVDNVKITALNSLYGAAPSFSVPIPTPSVAPGSTINYTGFSITADPLTP